MDDREDNGAGKPSGGRRDTKSVKARKRAKQLAQHQCVRYPLQQVKKTVMTRALTAEEVSKYKKSTKWKHSMVRSRGKRAATARKDRLWDYGIIPYDIEANFTGEVTGYHTSMLISKVRWLVTPHQG